MFARRESSQHNWKFRLHGLCWRKARQWNWKHFLHPVPLGKGHGRHWPAGVRSVRVGKHQLAPGQTACSDCAGGYVADSSGLPTCSICNGGKYANVEKSACMDCIVVTFSSAGSSLADSCSVYPANSFSQLAPRATMASSPQGVRQPITVILCCCCERKSLISNKQNI